MKKVLLSTVTVLAFSNPTNADTKHGFYVGLGVGVLAGHHDGKITTAIAGAPAGPSTDQIGFTKNALGIDVLVGYVAFIHKFLVGIELDYVFGNINKKNTIGANNTGVVTVKADTKNGALGAALRFGYCCSDHIAPYIRLGLESRRFTLFHNTVSQGNPIVTEILSSSRKTGFAAGIGIEYKVGKNVLFGGEYRYAAYSSINKSGNNPGLPSTVEYKVRPRVSTALVSIKYCF